MPNLYARATALPNVCGRLDYISSDHRQENKLAFYDGAAGLLDGQYWRLLAEESTAAFEQFGQKERPIIDRRTGEARIQKLKCCQGREIVLQLSNSLKEQNKLTDDEIVKTAVKHISAAIGQPVAGALHYNKAKNNLHLHLILPERELLKEPVIKVAERALFFDAQGKRRYKKSEILDENKQLLPGCRIVAKGEIYEQRYFGAVDNKYSSKAWMKELKTNTILALVNGDLKGDVEITEFDPSTGKLPQQHVGKRDKARDQETANRIREYNELVRRWNWRIDNGYIDHDRAMATQKAVMDARRRNAPLQEAVDEIEEAILQAEQERKRRAQDRENWYRYRSIRDDSWQTYLSVQRNEMAAIRYARGQMRELIEAYSDPIYNLKGELVGRRMKNPQYLATHGYFEKKEQLEAELDGHQGRLREVRNYENIAKGRQKIIRALMLAGAEQNAIDSAIREYEEASRLLQNHVQDPQSDYQGRRLKAAQDSLKMAEARAKRYIDRLTEEQKAEEEECQLMDLADAEYAEFQEEDKKTAQDLARAETADPDRKPSLVDQITGAAGRAGNGGSEKEKELER